MSYSISASYGINKLLADINSKPGGSGGMGFYISPINSLEGGIAFNMGSFKGSDNAYKYRKTTGVQYITTFNEISLRAKYNLYSLIDPSPYAKFAMYVSAGIGFINFRDRLEDLNGKYIAGYGYETGIEAKPKATTETYIPIGLGFKYRLDKNYSFAFEPVFNWCNTDKFDFVKDNKKDHYLFFPLVFEYRIYSKNVK